MAKNCGTRMGATKWQSIYSFISLLNVEPFLFAYMFVFTMKRVPTDQLVQDKVCRHTYDINATYCHSLPTMSPTDDYLGVKSRILTDVTRFTIYMTIFSTVPSVLTSLFIGSWTDTYIKAKKVLLMVGAAAGVVEAVILALNDWYFDWPYSVLLIATLPAISGGGILAVFVSVWSYVASTTPSHMRAIRMTFLEIVAGIAHPLGSYVGGVALNTEPMFNTGQLHNYTAVFIIAGGTSLLALLWAVFTIDEERDIRQWDRLFPGGETQDMGPDTSAEESLSLMDKRLKRFDDNRHKHPLKLLLNFGNVKEILITCFKRRPNRLRLRIWLLFLSTACYLLSHIAPVFFMFQFSQRAYAWGSRAYSNGSAIGHVVTTLTTTIVAPVLLRVFKMRDSTLSMVGLVSNFSLYFIRGVVLTPLGYYLALIPGCLAPLGAIGIRSHLSKVVNPDELGKVFCCMGCAEALMPLVGALVFTSIFNATIDSAPGLALIVLALVLIVPFVVMAWIRCFVGDDPLRERTGDLSLDTSNAFDKICDENQEGIAIKA